MVNGQFAFLIYNFFKLSEIPVYYFNKSQNPQHGPSANKCTCMYEKYEGYLVFEDDIMLQALHYHVVYNTRIVCTKSSNSWLFLLPVTNDVPDSSHFDLPDWSFIA